MESKPANINSTVEDYLKLLLVFRALPETKRTRTLMEVSGYPHYENVCSNILRFFFDPAAEHGLDDLLLAAFLRMARVPELPSLNNVSVKTRQATDGGNSLDILIEGATFTIGIENKIFHWLANDLEEYGKSIDRLAGKKPLVIKAVLGLREIEDKAALKGGFVSYSYGQFWQQVRAMLGNYISNATPKWISYLVDLMETTSTLAGEDMQLNKTDQFFIENHELIEKMLAGRANFLARLNQKAATLRTMISETAEAASLSKPPWVYQDSCVVLDFSLERTYSIAFDLYLEPTGWQLQLFGRNKKSQVYLAGLMKHRALRTRTSNAPNVDGRHMVQGWPLAADLGEIRESLRSWIRSVVAAANLKSA